MILAKVVAGALGLALLTALAASAASGLVYRAPQAYYLALGDSIAYGFQPTKGQTAAVRVPHRVRRCLRGSIASAGTEAQRRQLRLPGRVDADVHRRGLLRPP